MSNDKETTILEREQIAQIRQISVLYPQQRDYLIESHEELRAAVSLLELEIRALSDDIRRCGGVWRVHDKLAALVKKMPPRPRIHPDAGPYMDGLAR